MIPALLAIIDAPESLATMLSIPVPTKGASAFSNGTACLCMFEPIRALFASSFSRKGISEAATDTNCLGLTSINSTDSAGFNIYSPDFLVETKSFINLPFSSNLALA